MSIVQIANWKQDVFSEKTLSQVLRASIGVVGSPYDAAIAIFLTLVGVGLGAMSTFYWQVTAAADEIARVVQVWSLVSASFAAAILGFLIAGFSIFATMTEKRLFHDLSKIKSNGRKISDFKFIFYNFLYVFIQYLIYLGISLVVCFMFVEGSPVWFAASLIPQSFEVEVKFAALTFAVTFGVYSLYALLLLRSFIWSMYQSLLVAIFADA